MQDDIAAVQAYQLKGSLAAIVVLDWVVLDWMEKDWGAKNWGLIGSSLSGSNTLQYSLVELNNLTFSDH